MKIRLNLGLFESPVYDLEFTDDNLVLLSESSGNMEIPFDKIKKFNTDGNSKAVKRFLLQTDSSVYEGIFADSYDAKNFAEQLCKKIPCYIDIRIERLSNT